jgi:hypothetical protein
MVDGFKSDALVFHVIDEYTLVLAPQRDVRFQPDSTRRFER